MSLKVHYENTKKLKKKNTKQSKVYETEKIEKTALTLESELSLSFYFYLLFTQIYICSVCISFFKSINNFKLKQKVFCAGQVRFYE